MADTLVTIQVANWRTTEVQFLDENGAVIDLTGATGVLISKDPSGNSYATVITLGRVVTVPPSTQGLDAAQGWCWATFGNVPSNGTINVAGPWQEQMQLLLAGASEPLNGFVVDYTVAINLTRPA